MTKRYVEKLKFKIIKKKTQNFEEKMHNQFLVANTLIASNRFLPHLQRLQRLARPVPKIAYQVAVIDLSIILIQANQSNQTN